MIPAVTPCPQCDRPMREQPMLNEGTQKIVRTYWCSGCTLARIVHDFTYSNAACTSVGPRPPGSRFEAIPGINSVSSADPPQQTLDPAGPLDAPLSGPAFLDPPGLVIL